MVDSETKKRNENQEIENQLEQLSRIIVETFLKINQVEAKEKNGN